MSEIPGGWIQTVSGRRVYPLDMHPDMVDIRDITHALSRLCRYNGHSIRFYSVAEHSYHVSQQCSEQNALWGLLHDAAEAYFTDVSAPVKQQLPELEMVEQRILRAVCERFDLAWPMPSEVAEIDSRIVGDERKLLMSSVAHVQRAIADPKAYVHPSEWSCYYNRELGVELECWHPSLAEAKFLRLFYQLTAKGR